MTDTKTETERDEQENAAVADLDNARKAAVLHLSRISRQLHDAESDLVTANAARKLTDSTEAQRNAAEVIEVIGKRIAEWKVAKSDAQRSLGAAEAELRIARLRHRYLEG